MQTERVEQTLEIPVGGMDCAECASHVQDAVGAVAGVHSVEVRLAAERAVVQLDPTLASLADVRRAVERAGYTVPNERGADQEAPAISRGPSPILLVIGIVLTAGALVISEGVGVFDALQDRAPWQIGAALVVAGGFPIFRDVLRAALDRRITSHTLMTVGAAAALGTGEWVAAVLVVCFMRVGAYTERLTTERSRNALRSLSAAAPRTARVRRGSEEEEVPISQVGVGDVVIVRPGELIPVDGVVISGAATVQAAAITGESMPVEVGPGSRVHAATVAATGALHVRTTAVGRDSMYGRVIRLVEEAEAHRADVQRVADKFSAWYLPVVGTIATLVFLLRRDPQATAAVLVVACSCSFALATPIAMLSSIGAGAKRGLLFKGGKYLETLARADVLLIDKTGTLTLGKPQITDVVALNGASEREVLALAASAERYSEHPLAEAVRAAARERGLAPAEPENFEATAGFGVRAQVGGVWAAVGSRRMVAPDLAAPFADELEATGKTTLFVTRSGELIGVLAAADTPRPEARTALDAVRALGFKRIELLTGDNERAASSLAEPLGVEYRANLLPEDKIGVVREYQAKGGVVVMVGDGVNDAPALAQADVGIAMGVGGTDAAFEAAHIALMRDDWMLAPEAIHLARRTMRVVKLNLAFTAAYNVVGLSLAAFGFLPPVVAAAAQSLPDVGILANSSRLLRYRVRYDGAPIKGDADRPAAAASGAEGRAEG